MRRRPYQVILFDEIEKAHPEVWNALLQILEDGRLTDGQGHVVDFRNTVITMTSNVGTEFAKYGATLGFRTRPEEDEKSFHDAHVDDALKRTFRPEFLNRIDEIIVFHALSKEQVKNIVDLQMQEIQERLRAQGVEITLTDEAREWLAEEGYDPEFGARPLRRTLQREIESPLAKRLLAAKLTSDTTIAVSVKDDHLVFDIVAGANIAVLEPISAE